MNTQKIVLGLGLVVLLASTASADRHCGQRRGWGHGHRQIGRPVYVNRGYRPAACGNQYYAPAPIYNPAPVVYYQPQPYYNQGYQGGLSIGRNGVQIQYSQPVAGWGNGYCR